jgi:hypothetical protein
LAGAFASASLFGASVFGDSVFGLSLEAVALDARRVLFTGLSCWISSIWYYSFLSGITADFVRRLGECSGGLLAA